MPATPQAVATTLAAQLSIAVWLVASFVLAMSHATAQTPSPSPSPLSNAPAPIGIVDINGVLERSTAIAKLRAVIDEEDQRFQAAIEQERSELEQAERQLTADRENLDEAEFNHRRQEFDNRVIATQQRVQRSRQGFNESMQAAQDQIRALLSQIISDIAAERGFVIVLQRPQVVVFDNALDISDEALARLDDRTRDIRITPTSENVAAGANDSGDGAAGGSDSGDGDETRAGQ